jgi:hypothetical protein
MKQWEWEAKTQNSFLLKIWPVKLAAAHSSWSWPDNRSYWSEGRHNNDNLDGDLKLRRKNCELQWQFITQ